MQEGTFSGTGTAQNDTTQDATRFTADRRRRRVQAASTLTGHRVRNSAGEDLGRVEQIIIDIPSGRVAYAVLSFGGFLGTGINGSRYRGTPCASTKGSTSLFWTLAARLWTTPLASTKMPGPNMADPSFGAAVHQHYGKTPYWEHDVTDAGDYVGDDRQTNRSMEYDPTVGYRPPKDPTSH